MRCLFLESFDYYTSPVGIGFLKKEEVILNCLSYIITKTFIIEKLLFLNTFLNILGLQHLFGSNIQQLGVLYFW